MKRKRIYLTVTCLVFLLSTKSQHVTKTSPVIKFLSNLQSGILIGQKGSTPAFSINTVNGIKYSSWFAGIGVGIDYYGLKRSIPLFLNIQKDLSAKPNTWFWFAEAGYNFAWLVDNEKMKFVDKYKVVGGLFYEAGAGYNFTIFTKTRIGVSAGYSYKQLKEKYTYPFFRLPVGPMEQTNNNEYRRIFVKFNWWLL